MTRISALLILLALSWGACKQDISEQKDRYRSEQINKRVDGFIKDKLEACREDAWQRASIIVDSTLRIHPEQYLPGIISIPERPVRPKRDSFLPDEK